MSVRRSHPHPSSDLVEHAGAVARFTRDILQTSLCDAFVEWAELVACVAGYCHDLLKDTEAFERHLNGTPKSEQSRHSGGGAFIAWLVCKRILEANPTLLAGSRVRDITPHIVFNVLAAHHSGLRRVDLYGQHGEAIRHWQATRSSASTQMLDEVRARFDGVPNLEELDAELINARERHLLLEKSFEGTQADELFSVFFLSRLCLGALSRADVFSARNQETGTPEPDRYPPFEAKTVFHVDTAKFADTSGLNGLRSRFQGWASDNWNESDRLFQLKAPTGLGKTVAVTRIAEKTLAENPDARIFYLAPTVAILNQVYDELRQFKRGGDAVLLHYLIRDYDSEEELDYQPKNYDARCKSRDGKINDLDAGLIVTTYHRMLRLMGGLSKSTCLNLNNLRNSVWIMDECQFLTHYQITAATSLFAAIAEMTHARFVFMSATPPEPDYVATSFRNLKWPEPPPVRTLLTATQLSEITNDPLVNGRRVVHPLADVVRLEDLAGKIDDHRRRHPEQSLLVLLNLAGDARKLPELLECNVDFLITTYLRPLDVGKKLREAEESLRGEEPILMVATSIVQAGVDLDFDAGFVELNDLRDFRQGCGRVGRSFIPKRGCCEVFAFELKNSRETSSWYRQRFARKLDNTEDAIAREALETNCEIIQTSIRQVLEAESPLTDVDIERIEDESSKKASELSKNVFRRLTFGFPRSYDNLLYSEDRYQGFSFTQLTTFLTQDTEDDSDCSALAVFTPEDETARSSLLDQISDYRKKKGELYSGGAMNRFPVLKEGRRLKQEIFADCSPFLIRRFDVIQQFQRLRPRAVFYEDFDFWVVINPTAYSPDTGWKMEHLCDSTEADSSGVVM
mgnify:FL=1